MQKKDVCVVVAARNEAESIAQVLSGIRAVDVGRRIHILVVDDGSSDKTATVAAEHADRVISRSHRGLGYSVRQGYQFALDNKFDIVVNIDGDGQHDPATLPAFVRHLQNGSAIVKGTRFHPESRVVGKIPKDRLCMNQHFARTVSEITGFRITDALCGMYGFKREVLAILMPHLQLDGYGLCLEILIKGRYVLPHCTPLEVAHPAIYRADTHRHRVKYSSQGRDERERRFRDHEQHVVSCLAYCRSMGWLSPQ